MTANSFKRYLTVLPRILMVVTSEEDRVVEDVVSNVRDTCEIQIWNPSFGLMEGDKYIEEWTNLKHPEDHKTSQLNSSLIQAYKRVTSEANDNLYYVFLEIDSYLRDPNIQRRLKNIAISSHRNPRAQKSVILVSETGHVPKSLRPYVEVYDYDNPSESLIRDILSHIEEENRAVGENTNLPEALREKLSKFTLPANREGDSFPQNFIDACKGLTAFQLKETLNYLISKCDFQITTSDLQERRKEVLQNQNTELLEFIESDVDFDQIAGLENLKGWLKEIGLSWEQEGVDWGLPMCKGVLLVGVPGCGKSLTAKCLSNEWDLPLVKLDPSKLFSSRVGSSEANMHKALNILEGLSPAIVWIDEIEKGLSGIQSSSRSDSGTTARMIGTFLNWFQEHTSKLFVVATANGTENLPPELISRFEDIFFVDLPDKKTRKECFKIHLQDYWTEAMGDLEEIDLDLLAESSENFTGREINKVVREGLRKAYVSEEKKVQTQHLLESLNSKAPVARTMKEDIDALLEWVGYDEKRDEGIRARFASSRTSGPIKVEDLDDVNLDSRVKQIIENLDDQKLN